MGVVGGAYGINRVKVVEVIGGEEGHGWKKYILAICLPYGRTQQRVFVNSMGESWPLIEDGVDYGEESVSFVERLSKFIPSDSKISIVSHIPTLSGLYVWFPPKKVC